MEEGRVLVRRAVAEGVRFFDTSNIYGQGDSERVLADVLGRQEGFVVCSKAGRYFAWPKRFLVPVKAAIRRVTRVSDHARLTVGAARARPLPSCWQPDFLCKSIEGSLARLRRSHIEIFLLHSPDAEVLRRGDAMRTLEQAQADGKVGIIGASVDDVAAAQQALCDDRVRVLQIPLRPGETAFDAVARRATDAGVMVIAREVLGGAATMGAAADPDGFARARIGAMCRRPDVALSLIGTTRLPNLLAAVQAARAADALVT